MKKLAMTSKLIILICKDKESLNKIIDDATKEKATPEDIARWNSLKSWYAQEGKKYMMAWIDSRDDAIKDFTWDEQTIGHIDKYNGSLPSKITTYPRSEWLSKNLNNDYFNCNTAGASIKDGKTSDSQIVNIKFPGKGKQKLNTPATKAKSIINKPIDWLYKVIVFGGIQPTGSWVIDFGKFNPQSIKAQGILVTPLVPEAQPQSGSITPEIPITLSAACDSTIGTKETLGTITDPTGATESSSFPITLTCIGPVISQPANLTMSAEVGSTATGSFTFSNDTEADDLGRKAPLSYTITAPNLNPPSPSAGTLAGGSSQTVTVSKLCSSASDNGTYPVTIADTDPTSGVASKTVNVTLECKASAPIISVPPTITFTGNAGSNLSYSLTGAGFTFNNGSGSVAGGKSQSITASKACINDQDSGTYTINITSNDSRTEAAKSISVNK